MGRARRRFVLRAVAAAASVVVAMVPLLAQAGGTPRLAAARQPGTATSGFRFGGPQSGVGANGSSGLSCGSPSLCLANASGNDEYAFLRYNGRSWTPSLRIPSSTFSLAVSCSSGTFCMDLELVTAPSRDEWTIQVRRYRSGVWSSPQVLGSTSGYQGATLACHSRGLCFAALMPYFMTVPSTLGWVWRHGTWTSWPAKWGGTGQPGSAACPTASFCRYGEVMPPGNVFTYAQGHWFRRHLNTRGCGGHSFARAPCPAFFDLSCPTARFCVAAASSHWAYVYQAGEGWKPAWVDHTQGAYLDTVSCPATTFCVAGSNHGQVFYRTARGWSKPVRIDTRRHTLIAISCATTRFCVAIDNDDQAFIGR